MWARVPDASKITTYNHAFIAQIVFFFQKSEHADWQYRYSTYFVKKKKLEATPTHRVVIITYTAENSSNVIPLSSRLTYTIKVSIRLGLYVTVWTSDWGLDFWCLFNKDVGYPLPLTETKSQIGIANAQ